MVFQSWYYLFFVIGLATVQVFISSQWRWLTLLTASIYFYALTGWQPLLLLLLTIILTYWSGQWLGQKKDQKIRYRILLISCWLQILILGVFKYLGFLNDIWLGLSSFFAHPSWSGFPSFILPLGISFFTFQSMGYVFDVYYKIRKPENHFGHYALFVSFFPQIQSGPIGRSKEMLPQWLKISRPTWLDVRFSILLFSWGVLKKLVIADRLGNYVDEVYQQPDAHGTFVWLFILALYTFQLYADFSAYTDMAIASARVLGIKISENFMYPYKANNITDFWRRWHLSLSNWLRDYVYTPLLFSKKKWKKGAVLYAIAVTFVICGIWHGPKMTFVVFGILQAAFLIFEMLTKESRASWSQYVHPKLYQSMSVMLTFSVISFCFIFFRAENMEMVRQIFHQILNFNNMGWLDYVHQKNGSMLLGILAMIILFVLLDSRISEGIRKNDGPFLGMTIFNACLWVIIILAGVFGREVFIYFQF